MNNVTNVSMYDEYAGMLGITKEELSGQLSEDFSSFFDINACCRMDWNEFD